MIFFLYHALSSKKASSYWLWLLCILIILYAFSMHSTFFDQFIYSIYFNSFILFWYGWFFLHIFTFFFLNWSIVGLHCCVSFCCIAKWISLICIYVCVYICVHFDIYVYTFVCVYIHTYTYISYKHTHIYIYQADSLCCVAETNTAVWIRASQVVLLGKSLPANAGRCKRCGLNPWVGKIPWRRAQQPTPVSCQENPMDRGTWWVTIHGVAELHMTEAT